jgi:hypothetical protein
MRSEWRIDRCCCCFDVMWAGRNKGLAGVYECVVWWLSMLLRICPMMSLGKPFGLVLCSRFHLARYTLHNSANVPSRSSNFCYTTPQDKTMVTFLDGEEVSSAGVSGIPSLLPAPPGRTELPIPAVSTAG